MNARETYCLTRLTGVHSPAIQGPRQQLHSEFLPSLHATGARVWGAFAGLFGLAADEVFVMTSSPSGSDPSSLVQQAVAKSDGLAISEQHALAPTVRPTDEAPLEREGLYVVRLWQTETRDIEEFVSLSADFWRVFEGGKGWQNESVGLFAPSQPSGEHSVLVSVTWYDGFSSWEASRTVLPANANVMRRAELTLNTTAYATRLLRT